MFPLVVLLPLEELFRLLLLLLLLFVVMPPETMDALIIARALAEVPQTLLDVDELVWLGSL